MKISNSQNNKSLVTAASCLILAVALLRLLWLTSQSMPDLKKSATATFNNLPFSIEKQLRQRYGDFYYLVESATSNIPKCIDPIIRSGARIVKKEACMVRQKFPHHGRLKTDVLYAILCHGIAGYSIKPEFINQPYPIFQQRKHDREITVPANTSLRFSFTTGIDVDSLKKVYLSARSTSSGYCTLKCFDKGTTPPSLLGKAKTELIPNKPVVLEFSPPVPLLYSHGATPYLLDFEFSCSVKVGVKKTSKPNQSVEIGTDIYPDTELTTSIVGTLIDTSQYTLIDTPVPEGFIYGKTSVLRKLGINLPFTKKDYETLSNFVIGNSEIKIPQ